MKKIYLLICFLTIASSISYAQTAKMLWEQKVGNPILITQISPDGRYLLDTESNHYLFDLQDINKAPVTVPGLLDNPHFANNNKIISKSETQISIYDIATNTNKIVDLDFIDTTIQEQKETNNIITYTDKYLISYLGSNYYQLYSLETKTKLKELPYFSSLISYRFSHDGKQVIMVNSEYMGRLTLEKYDIEQNKMMNSFTISERQIYESSGNIVNDSIMFIRSWDTVYTANYQSCKILSKIYLNKFHGNFQLRKISASDSTVIYSDNTKKFTTVNFYTGETVTYNNDNTNYTQFAMENGKLIGYLGLGDGILKTNFITGEKAKIREWNCHNIDNMVLWNDTKISFENHNRFVVTRPISDSSYSALVIDYRTGAIIDSFVIDPYGLINKFDENSVLYHRNKYDSLCQVIDIRTMNIVKEYKVPNNVGDTLFYLGNSSGHYSYRSESGGDVATMFDGEIIDITTGKWIASFNQQFVFQEWLTEQPGVYKYLSGGLMGAPTVSSVYRDFYFIYALYDDWDLNGNCKKVYYLDDDRLHFEDLTSELWNRDSVNLGIVNMKNLKASMDNKYIKVTDNKDTYIFDAKYFSLKMKIENVIPTRLSENFKYIFFNNLFHKFVLELDYTSAVEDGKLDIGIKLYPNPTTEQISIENASADISVIEIFDTQGKLWQSVKNSDGQNIDVSNLPKGAYIAKMIASGVAISKPFVIIK